VPSFSELLVIIFVVVLIFGAQRLPQIGNGLGRAIRNFKTALKGDNEIDVTPGQKKVPPPSERK
jgi:sec-independent protein translocase protein TatA